MVRSAPLFSFHTLTLRVSPFANFCDDTEVGRVSKRRTTKKERKKGKDMREGSGVSEVAPQSLVSLKSLKKTLEVSCSESVEVIALNYFHKHSGAIKDMLRKDLK